MTMSNPEPLSHLLQIIDGMLADIAPGVVEDTDVQDLRHILWFLGNEELGTQPGSFDEHLLRTAAHADAWDLAQMGQVFPHLAAFDIARSTEAGMQLVIDRVRRYEAATSAAFGTPVAMPED